MNLKVNRKYKITSLPRDIMLARRLCELGFYIGNIIVLKKISLLKKSYLFICRNVAISLTRNIVEELVLIDEQ